MVNVELSPDHIATFQRDGFVIVESMIDPATVALLTERYRAIFNGEFESGLIPDEVNWQADTGASDATRQICNAWKGDRHIARVVLDPAIGRACALLGEWPGARINQDNVFWKPPGGAAVGFHQDAAYEDWVIPSDMISCWIALDDTTVEGGTVEYVRGSQTWGEAEMIAEFHAPTDPTAEMRAAARRAGVVAPECVPIVVPAGSGTFHHGRVWHGSRINRSDHDRRSLVAHCMSSDARYRANNVGPIYGRYKRFGDDTMDESFFPVLWRNDGYRSPFLEAYARGEIAWGGAT